MTDATLTPAKRRAFTLILVLILVAMAELCGAVGWRMLSDLQRQTVLFLCHQKTLTPKFLPNAFWHHDLNPKHPEYRGIINSHGTKGEDFPLPKPEGEYRIICLGDSTVEGIRLPPEETFEHYLEQQLNSWSALPRNIRRVRVINAGVSNHNSAFNLAYLEYRLIHFQPDAFIIKSSYNDYLPLCIPGMKYDYTNAFPRPYSLTPNSSPYWWFARHSRLLKVAGALLFQRQVRNTFADFAGHLDMFAARSFDFSANADRLFVYGDNLRSMVAICSSRNIRLAFLDLPTSPDSKHYSEGKFSQGFRRVIARLERELETVARETGTPIIRTTPLVAGDFIDHCHNSSAGNRKIADRIFAAITGQLGWLSSVSS